jgi:predicted aldo/keto reductase-like oxidoreductase
MAKKLSFDCMRLPLLDKDDQTSVDLETLNKLVDTFIERGFAYFDTALTYHGFKSEDFVREALVKRHRREEYTLATKLPPRIIKVEDDQGRIFNGQLERCGVEYFDYYLIHNIGYNMNLTSTHGKAGDCIGCKKCELACPQHLKISELLKTVSATFDNGPGLPTK